jgi:hypothetical protein
MSESTCPVCAERCHRLRVEYRNAVALGAKGQAKRAKRLAKRSGCRWAKGKVGKP